MQVTHLVIRKRETDAPEVYPFDSYEDAAVHYDAARQQWSDTFLCEVIDGPADKLCRRPSDSIYGVVRQTLDLARSKGFQSGRDKGLAEARGQARALNTAHRRLRRRYERLRERVLDVASVARQVGFAEVARPYDAVFSLAVPTARFLDWLETALSSGAVYEFMAKQWMEHPHPRRARLAETCSASPAEVDCPMCTARPGEPCRH